MSTLSLGLSIMYACSAIMSYFLFAVHTMLQALYIAYIAECAQRQTLPCLSSINKLRIVLLQLTHFGLVTQTEKGLHTKFIGRLHRDNRAAQAHEHVDERRVE